MGVCTEPTLEELTEALGATTDVDGLVPVGIAPALASRNGWGGRIIDVLGIVTQDVETMAYLAGGRRPYEVATWLTVWVDSPLSIDQMRLVVAAGGWDPEPFVVLARAEMLEDALREPDGSLRRFHGELAGGWISDQLPLADETEVIHTVSKEIVEDEVETGRAGTF